MLFGDHDTVHREDLSRLPNPDAIQDSCELELRNAEQRSTAANSFALSVGRVTAAIPGYPSRFLTTFRPRSPKNRSDSGAHRQSRMYPKLPRKVEVQNCIMLSA